MLKGKAAIVTGSTSGIGLGIARALAEAGANIMLNGFGEASAIEKERAQIAKDFGVRAVFNAANMAIAMDVERLVESRNPRAEPGGYPGQQRWNPTYRASRTLPGRAVGCSHRHQPVVEFSCHPRCDPSDAGAQLGAHHQHCFGAWTGGIGGKGRLRGGQAWSDRTYQSRGARDGNERNYLQCDLSGLGSDAARREANQGTGSSREKISIDRAKSDLLSEKQPSHEFATPEQIGALTVFLCSEAAAQIRGAALPVDGGWTAQ